MEQLPFVFTIFFMLLGPVKLVPSFAGVTKGANQAFKRSVAFQGAVIASALCLFVALAGQSLLVKYRISFDALRIGGGLVLLIAALQATFRKAPAPKPATAASNATQLAVSPVAVPNIVPPAGVAAILVFMMLAPDTPGMAQAVAVGLAVVMVLDFLMMYFIDSVLKIPGLGIVLTVLGSVLVFVQICLAIQMMLAGLEHVGA